MYVLLLTPRILPFRLRSLCASSKVRLSIVAGVPLIRQWIFASCLVFLIHSPPLAEPAVNTGAETIDDIGSCHDDHPRKHDNK